MKSWQYYYLKKKLFIQLLDNDYKNDILRHLEKCSLI